MSQLVEGMMRLLSEAQLKDELNDARRLLERAAARLDHLETVESVKEWDASLAHEILDYLR
jgi:hypothetical protein